VFVRNLLRAPVNFRPFESWTFGSEVNGGFAEYTVVHSDDAFRVESELSDVELGTIPCAYSTAEGMLMRAGVTADDRVLVTGASGGVGLAAVQLAKLRGSHVIAVVAPSKADALRDCGADTVLHRGDRLLDRLDRGAVTVVVDLVAGEQWQELLPLLRRGGRYVTAGAIGGPIVEMDVRTLYLNDLSLFGCTFQDDAVFNNIVSYLQAGRLKPVIAKTFDLANIVEAQKYFMAKHFVGKVALILP
jgi:NADPH:quinone reductase-like Zn-dependent oxidoreductase